MAAVTSLGREGKRLSFKVLTRRKVRLLINGEPTNVTTTKKQTQSLIRRLVNGGPGALNGIYPLGSVPQYEAVLKEVVATYSYGWGEHSVSCPHCQGHQLFEVTGEVKCQKTGCRKKFILRSKNNAW